MSVAKDMWGFPIRLDQMGLLQWLSEPGCTVRYVRWVQVGAHAWAARVEDWNSEYPRLPTVHASVARAALKKGWIAVDHDDANGTEPVCQITDAGRAALAAEYVRRGQRAPKHLTPEVP